VGDGHLWDTAYKGEWPPYNVGDVVIYGRYAGFELAMEDEDEELWPRVMTVDEILGVVTNAA
jgi:co-chaperonin GroES (HSP10)